MNKEQVAFLSALALMLLFWFGCQGSSDAPSRVRRGAGGGAQPPREILAGQGRFLAPEDHAWVGHGSNIFLAPRELKPLPPLKLLPPPFPRLPHPGLTTTPAVGGPALVRLRHPLQPDPSIVIPSGDTRVVLERESDPDAMAEAEAELDVVDRSFVGMSLADQLRMKEEERLQLERERALAAQRREDRLKTLDRVFWETGQTSYGEIRAARSEDSRYELKLKLDAVRSNPSLSEDQKRRELERIRFAFYEDRGPARRPSRAVLTGAVLSRVEFAETDALARFELERLRLPADDEDAQIRLSDAIYQSGEYAVVAGHLDALHRRGMGSETSFLRCSDSYRRTLRYDDELRVIQEGLARFPDSPALLSALGDVLLNVGLRSKAVDAYRKALGQEPVHASANYGLGRALVLQGEPEAALPHLRQAQGGAGLRGAGERQDALILLGETYLLLGDLDAARRTLDSALDRDPEHARALAGRAAVALAETGPQAAMVYILRGRGAAPLHGVLAYLEGVCALRMGDYRLAQQSLVVAMDLDPLITADVRAALSYLFEKAGRDEAALSEADQALTADPGHQGARLQKARSLLNVGDLRSAQELYLQALAVQPFRADILVALGDVAFRLGDAASAYRYYERAHKLDASFPDLLGRRLVSSIQRRDRATADAIMKAVDAGEGREAFVQAAQGFYYYEIASESREAVQRLRPLTERTDIQPALAEYSKAVIQQITDHENKEEWRDEFNYRGTQVLGKWQREVGSGINVVPQEGRVRFVGSQKRVSFEPTVLYQEREARKIESFRAVIDVSPQPAVHAGVGLIAFQRAPRPPDPYPGMQTRGTDQIAYYGGQVAVSPSGQLQFRFLDKGKMSEWADIPGEVHRGGSIALGLEVIDRKESVFRLTIDGRQSVALRMPELSQRGRALEIQLFVQAQLDRAADMAVDQVSIVTLKN